ncbi:hypothetical protein BRD00_02955 [Halobacteriales archaeon QS_8_69_26]|nr:MAG: hypothetical protein BRD00_02955 [Halobacteriales archaeon QS_8_69_26]
MFDNESAFRERRVEVVRESLDFGDLGIEPEDVEGQTTVATGAEAASEFLSASVYRVDYDREALADEFGDDWVRSDHRGYTLLARDGFAARGWAVGDDVFVQARVPQGIEDGTRFDPALERAVDVGTGAADGYLARSEDGEALVSALGDGMLVDGRPSIEDPPVEGVVAFGENRFEADAGVRGRFVAVFEDADAADPGAVKELEFLRRRYPDLSAEADGRRVVASGNYDPPEQ